VRDDREVSDDRVLGLVVPERRRIRRCPVHARLRTVFVVHATKKVLDRCGGPSSTDREPTTTALGN